MPNIIKQMPNKMPNCLIKCLNITPGTSTWYNKTENTQTNNKRHTPTHPHTHTHTHTHITVVRLDYKTYYSPARPMKSSY